jgi:Ca-activated chloride channel family protein
MLLLGWVFLVLALAEPRWGYEEKKMVSHGRDLIIAIDTSHSMLATDVVPTRLARAQLLGQDLLDLLPGDRVGMIAFAGNAFLQAPMTLDHSAVAASIAELDTMLIPKGGTDICDAIRTAEVAFGKGEGSSRAFIIITDGEDLEGNAVAEAKSAAAQGIRIFTIGIGSAAGSLLPIKNEHGGVDFVRDEHDKPVLSKLDEPRLKEIAQVTGGLYEPLSPQAAQRVVEQGILPLEAHATGEMSARRPIERYLFPASLALLCLVLSILLKDGKKLSSFWRQGGGVIKKTTLLLLVGTAVLHATPGIKEYERGDYEAALQRFEQRLNTLPSSPQVRFDAGTAAYKHGDYQKAADYFTAAMTSSDLKLQEDATYNLANTLVRSGEQQQDPETKLSHWKNALQHYDTVLKQDPHNKNAKENRALVEKLIEKLKQEEKKPPQKQQNQHQNQQQNQSQSQSQQQPQQGEQPERKQQQQQQPQNSQPQQASGDGSPSPTPPPSSNNPTHQQDSSAPGEEQSSPKPTPSPSPAEQPSSSPKEQQSGDNNKSSSPQQPKPTPSLSPIPSPKATEKKSGSLQEARGGEAAQTAPTEEEQPEGKGMSRRQAEGLLRSVQEEEQQVQFQQRRHSEEVIKDW